MLCGSACRMRLTSNLRVVGSNPAGGRKVSHACYKAK
jgi:hypothetical protein